MAAMVSDPVISKLNYKKKKKKKKKKGGGGGGGGKKKKKKKKKKGYTINLFLEALELKKKGTMAA